MNERFCKTPPAPYYVVIFSGQLGDNDDGYAEMGAKMFDLALSQPGCLGAESTRDAAKFGITISYWQDEQSIRDWKENAKHLVAQNQGINAWYTHYEIRIAKVERAYSGPQGRSIK